MARACSPKSSLGQMQRRGIGGTCRLRLHAMLFEDRFHAGRELASKLGEFRDRDDTVVLALPRGGVSVGYEVAKAIHAPFDVFVVRKLGVPGQEELAMGALASGGITVFNREAVEHLAISSDTIKTAISREGKELERREREYREGRPAANIQGRTVILVDDGLATGSSMRVAAMARASRSSPAELIAGAAAATASISSIFPEQWSATSQPAATTPEARLPKVPLSASIPRSSLISQPSKPMRCRMISRMITGDRLAGRSLSHAV